MAFVTTKEFQQRLLNGWPGLHFKDGRLFADFDTITIEMERDNSLHVWYWNIGKKLWSPGQFILHPGSVLALSKIEGEMEIKVEV